MTRTFDDWTLAFDFAREADKPITAIIAGTRYKIYPSGKVVDLDERKKQLDYLKAHELGPYRPRGADGFLKHPQW